MKIAKIFWSLGSLLINVVIGVYIYLMSNAPQTNEERYAYINEKWDLFAAHWKIEFLLMAMISASTLYFAIQTRKMSWSVITIGQIILLLTYPIMLGGYPNTPFELAEMANQMATVVFVFGNIIFMGGLFILYCSDEYLQSWLKGSAIFISGLMTLIFLIVFLGLITWHQALITAPLANVIYLINAYYGFKIKISD